MKKIKLFFTFSFLVAFASISNTIYCQIPDNVFIEKYQINPSDSNKLFFSVRNLNFLKNNEYFNNIVSGYTLIGYWIQPEFSYQPSPKSKLTVGAGFLKYSGTSNYRNILPVLRYQQQLAPYVSLVMGSLYGSLNHRLLEPVYDPERYITYTNDNGLEFLIQTKHVWSDVWLNWEHFIYDNDSTQERLSGGISSRFLLFDSTSTVNIEIPFQVMLFHRGGQINAAKNYIETLSNFVSGFSLVYKPSGSFVDMLKLNAYVLGYSNLSPAKFQPYGKGWGLYPNIEVEAKGWYLKTGWWHGTRFIGPRGEAIYSSIAKLDPSHKETFRDLLVGKLAYSHTWKYGVSLAVNYEMYYDTRNKLYDYNYGLQLIYNMDFLIKKL